MSNQANKKQGADPPVRATVSKIIGLRPPERSYVVAYPMNDHGELKKSDSVTFSIPGWYGRGQGVSKGQIIDLYGVSLFKHGWRASRACPVLPATSK